jgi:hypothetical protein
MGISPRRRFPVGGLIVVAGRWPLVSIVGSTVCQLSGYPAVAVLLVIGRSLATLTPVSLNCEVLRCMGIGAQQVVKEGPWGRQEHFVCDRHHASIQAAARWVCVDDGGILMGDDLPPLEG